MNARDSDSFRLPNAMAAFSCKMLICLFLGCGHGADTKGPIRKITIVDHRPFTVVAEISKKSPAEGAIFTKGITVVHQDKLQISSAQGVVFYDNDQSGSLERDKDGIILTFDEATVELNKELSISPGVVHTGPGIGPLRLECKVEVVSDNGDRKWIPLSVDLSPIFKVDATS
jgi:hypothetical protein